MGNLCEKMSVQSHSQTSEKEKFHGNWNLHVIWGVSARRKTICRVSRSLCSKKRGHILKIIFFYCPKSSRFNWSRFNCAKCWWRWSYFLQWSTGKKLKWKKIYHQKATGINAFQIIKNVYLLPLKANHQTFSILTACQIFFLPERSFFLR